MKTNVGIVRDHSGSMAPHRILAASDYNNVIEGFKSAAKETDIDTVVSVVKCGVGADARIEREIILSSVNALKPLTDYVADGSRTPLWDSVGDLINLYEEVPDLEDQSTSFLIVVVTDGQENHSIAWSAGRLRDKIFKLQATDRWSFVFRVPRGYSNQLSRALGVPLGNILEWEQTEQGFALASAHTVNATRNYYEARNRGVRSTTRFYADLHDLAPAEIRRELKDISRQVVIWDVKGRSPIVIKSFCETQSGNPYIKGRAYYQLIKTETVQDYKGLVIHQLSSGAVYSGEAARSLLGLPIYGSIRLTPGDYGDYELFVQSTSLNRVLVPGSKLLYLVKP